MTQTRVLREFAARRHRHSDCIADALAAAERSCRARGQRLTPLRRRVLELVWNGHAPVKAYDVLQRLQREHKGAAPPTVYRALDFLLQEGLVHRIESLNAYVGCGAPGHTDSGQFLICRDCGDVAEITDPELPAALARRAGKIGFSVDDQVVEVRGCCAQCRDRR